MAVKSLSAYEENVVRNCARRYAKAIERLLVLDVPRPISQREKIQTCEDGYWVPALVFVSDEQVEKEIQRNA